MKKDYMEIAKVNLKKDTKEHVLCSQVNGENLAFIDPSYYYKEQRDELTSLLNLLQHKDTYTWQHSKKVALFSNFICIKMSMSYNRRLRVFNASLLHDIGKIHIDDLILNKTSNLSTEEYNLIKEHTIIGENLVRGTKYLNDLSGIIRSHHERWDGKGYPDCLERHEIPIASQIIAVTDTFEALTSDRTYRKSISKDKALDILFKESGKQFNPEIVHSFVEIILNNY